MDRISSDCPGLRTLRDYTAARLGLDAEWVRGHLRNCPRCQGIVEGLEATRKDPKPGAEVGWTETEMGVTTTMDASSLVSVLADPAPVAEPDAELDPEEEAELDFLEPPVVPGSIGRLAQYDIQGVLGRGGMGIVLRAFDPKLHRVVAIKVLAPRLASSQRARKRFMHEARSAAAINHPNVVTIHAVESQGDVPYLVMECIPGQSLRQRIRTAPRLKPKQMLRIGLQVATALEAAHGQGVIHRDIKPANIMLEDNIERAKLTDFGLAVAALTVSDLTSTDHLVGTPEYMSPEQVRGEKLDPRSDLFSLGCVLYAMVAGHSPFKGRHALDTIRRVTDLDPPTLRSVDPSLPPELSELVERLLNKEPGERPESATEVVQRLRQILVETSWQDSVESNTTAPIPARDPEAELAGTTVVSLPVVAQARPGADRMLWRLLTAAAVLLAAALLIVGARALLDPGREPQLGFTEIPAEPAPRPVLTVGGAPGADFPSLARAVAQVKRPGTTIRILDSGTYNGVVEIKDSPAHERLTITAAPGQRPVLTAPGRFNTIVKFDGTPGVTLRGVTLSSSTDQFGLVVGGYSAGVRIEDVRFEKREAMGEHVWSHVWLGAMARGVEGNPIRFEGCAFSPWRSGLVMQGNAGGLIRHVEVLGCRFALRERALELIAPCRSIRIAGNLFVGCASGVVLDNLSDDSGAVQIANNTFFEVAHWIDPTASLPEVPGIRVVRNAVIGSVALDTLDGRLAAAAAGGWVFADNLWESSGTDGPPLATPRAALAVRSRDPSSPEFLRPAPGSLLLEPDSAGQPRQIGALGPPNTRNGAEQP